jgi:hypothetical protein
MLPGWIMDDAHMEKFEGDGKKPSYALLAKKLSAIKEGHIGWPSQIDCKDSDYNITHPYYPHDDYPYVQRIDERGRLWKDIVKKPQDHCYYWFHKNQCHTNCIRLYSMKIVTGFAYAEKENWIRHSWLWIPAVSSILETTGHDFQYYYGYVVEENEIDEFYQTFNV